MTMLLCRWLCLFLSVQFLLPGSEPPLAMAAPARAWLGTRNVAVLQLQFAGEDAPAYDRTTLESMMQEAAQFYEEASYGQFRYSWTVLGPLSVRTERPCTLDEKVNAAKIADTVARSSGIDLSRFDTFVYTGSMCSPSAGTRYEGNIGVVLLSGGGDARLLAHELGHTLGLGHATSVECPAVPLVAGPSRSGCTTLEYGDPMDVMGTLGLRHFSAPHKEWVGWLRPQEVRGSGIYSVAPIELPAGALPQALKILPSTGNPLWIEYRQPLGFDRPGINAPGIVGMFQGALLHLGPFPGQLLRMQPESGTGKLPQSPTFVNGIAALLPGATYTDPMNRFTIKTLSATPERLEVAITINPDTPAPRFSFGQPLEGTSLSGLAPLVIVPEVADQIAGVELLVDDRPLGTAVRTEGAPLFRRDWDTSSEVTGPHRITAIVTGTDGSTARRSISVTVGRRPEFALFTNAYSVLVGSSVTTNALVTLDPSVGIDSIEFALAGPSGVRRQPATLDTSSGFYTARLTLPEPGIFNIWAEARDSLGVIGWSGSIQVEGGNTVIATGGVRNAANALPFISPGGLVSIYGAAFAREESSATALPLPTSLGETSVLIGGVPAPMLYAGPGQVNVQVPWSLASRCTGQTVNVLVEVAVSGPSGVAISRAPCMTAAPAVFQMAGRQALAAHVDGAIADAARPARRGETLVVLATGLGAVIPTPGDGEAGGATLRTAVIRPTVTIGGTPARVEFAGLSPDYVGVYQINVVVPEAVTSGSSVVLSIRSDAQEDARTTLAVE